MNHETADQALRRSATTLKGWFKDQPPHLRRYFRSYPALIELGRATADHSNHHGLIALTCAAYGWMPTILKDENFGENPLGTPEPVCAVRALTDPTAAGDFLAGLCDCYLPNRSWIGASKLLHFLKPDLFPIWDANVAICFDLDGWAKVNRKKAYLSYLEFVHRKIEEEPILVNRAADLVEKNHGYRPSPVRVIELLLFVCGREIRKRRRNADDVRT